MAILTPDQRHALTDTEAHVAATATLLAERWIAATVAAEDTITVEPTEPEQRRVKTKRTIYRCAQTLPVSLAGLSPEQTTCAIERAVALLTLAGWTVTTQRSVVTLVGIPTADASRE